MKEGRAQLVWAKNNFVEQLLAGTIFKDKLIFIRKQFTLPGRKTRWSVFCDAQLSWWQRLERQLPAISPRCTLDTGQGCESTLLHSSHCVYLWRGKDNILPKGLFFDLPTRWNCANLHLLPALPWKYLSEILSKTSHTLVLFAFSS